MQFIPIVEHSPEEGLSRRSVHPRQFGRFLSGVFELWREHDIGEVFVQHFEVMLAIVMGYPSALCVHSEECGRNVAMEHNGDVFVCDHFVEPQHLLGNLMETPLTELLDSEQTACFGADKFRTLPRVCRQCRYLSLCNGGCPAHRFGRAPGGGGGLNYLCEGYRLFYSHSLPHFQAMAAALRAGRPAREHGRFRAAAASSGRRRAPVSRNAPCPCGSGKKYKHCCGRGGLRPPTSR